MQHDVSVIIPVWNLWETTKNCLESLRGHTPPQRAHIIVVDNGSTDATVEKLYDTGTRLFGEAFTLLRLEKNEGFAVACNRGAAIAQTPYLLFLNNDTLLTPNWLPPLVRAMENDPSLAGAGPLLLYPSSNLVQHCGISFTPAMQLTHLYSLFPYTHPCVRKQRRLQAITAAALLMRRHEFIDNGGFYEGFVNGYEDVDLCARLLRQNKYFTCVAESTVYHLESQTPGRKDKETENSTLLRERFKDVFKPDLLDIAKEDGFEARLNPKLDCIIKLPDSLEQQLSARFHSACGPEAMRDCWNTLQEYPLWQGGYGILIRLLQQAKDAVSAFEMAQLEANFFPSPLALGRLQKTALAAGHQDTADIAQAHLAFWLERANAPQLLAEQAQSRAAWAAEHGYAPEYNLYADWLQSRGHAPHTQWKDA